MNQAVERRGAKEEAFALFDNAVQIAPDNVLVRYRRAKLLIVMKRYNVNQVQTTLSDPIVSLTRL
jgi:anaphase-promoting complex subunit 3